MMRDEALAWTIAASGGMLLISDDVGLLDDESSRLFVKLRISVRKSMRIET